MYRTFFKGARAGVAMQAFPVVERLVKLDVLRGRRRSEVINVDMSQPAQLGLDRVLDDHASV